MQGLGGSVESGFWQCWALKREVVVCFGSCSNKDRRTIFGHLGFGALAKNLTSEIALEDVWFGMKWGAKIHPLVGNQSNLL